MTVEKSTHPQAGTMNQAAICPVCKRICGVVVVTGRNKVEVATHMRDWARRGYIVKYVTNSYVKTHHWGCVCEPHLPGMSVAS
jgi:hypothetical protein